MPATIRNPQTGETFEDRRQGGDRRTGERREGDGRRAEDRARRRTHTLVAAFWAVVGSIVVMYLFFLALDAIDPADSRIATFVVVGLAVLWLAHAWRRLLIGGYSSKADRERRGF